MDDIKVVIATCESGDWMGIYVNDELKAENHSLSVRDALSLIGIPFAEVEVDDEWLEEEMAGRFPKKAQDLPAKEARCQTRSR